MPNDDAIARPPAANRQRESLRKRNLPRIAIRPRFRHGKSPSAPRHRRRQKGGCRTRLRRAEPSADLERLSGTEELPSTRELNATSNLTRRAEFRGAHRSATIERHANTRRQLWPHDSMRFGREMGQVLSAYLEPPLTSRIS